jgi:hypothetical protein
VRLPVAASSGWAAGGGALRRRAPPLAGLVPAPPPHVARSLLFVPIARHVRAPAEFRLGAAPIMVGPERDSHDAHAGWESNLRAEG